MSDMVLLRLDQVRAKTGLCRSAVYALPDFPRPVKLGGRRAVGWVGAEVDQWILRTIAASRRGGGDEQAA
jgi:prophage regulatory protein